VRGGSLNNSVVFTSKPKKEKSRDKAETDALALGIKEKEGKGKKHSGEREKLGNETTKGNVRTSNYFLWLLTREKKEEPIGRFSRDGYERWEESEAPSNKGREKGVIA